METYIKVYDWMSGMPLKERMVYALVYQLTEAGSGWWSTNKAMSDRLGIPKSHCRQALEHLREIGAISMSTQTILHRERKIYTADPVFANRLQEY